MINISPDVPKEEHMCSDKSPGAASQDTSEKIGQIFRKRLGREVKD